MPTFYFPIYKSIQPGAYIRFTTFQLLFYIIISEHRGQFALTKSQFLAFANLLLQHAKYQHADKNGMSNLVIWIWRAWSSEHFHNKFVHNLEFFRLSCQCVLSRRVCTSVQSSGSLKCTIGDERMEENLLKLLQFTFSVSVQPVSFLLPLLFFFFFFHVLTN